MLKSGVAYLSYIIYLRKSRQDDPNETIEEVLSKHEMLLQEFAEREFGKRIPDENIYREVVSGESIDDREEIQKVLSRIEDPAIEGVLVIEPSRLSRGDLSDCARIIDSFRFTHTQVVTPMMTYNLEKKMERKFFQDELLRGNDYLEYTKEILFRGRVAAAKRGCFIQAIAPYGYDRIKVGRDWTLTPNDNADTVRMIFEWYAQEGLSPGAIARRLNSLGYVATNGGKWSRESIQNMLVNRHYIGKIVYNEYRNTWVVEDGKRVKKLIRQPDEDIIISEGKHPAIVSIELFEAVRARMSKNPKVKNDHELINPLAGVIKCACCGKAMILDRNLHTTSVPRYKCRRKPSCGMKSAKAEEVWEAVLFALEYVELPNLQAKLKNGDGEAAAIQKRRIAKLSQQLEDYKQQEDEQYELLERKKYTQDLFDRRNAALREKMEACEKELHLARTALPKNVDYAERIVSLEKAIAGLKNNEMPNREKNKLLRNVVDKMMLTTKSIGHNNTDISLRVFLRF